MSFVNSPNMGLPVPTVSGESGPQFASDVNQCLAILDAHTHLPGNGVPIGAQSINLQSDLTFNTFNATNLRTVRFNPVAASSGTDIGCVYVKGVDLYYNDLNANVVRITQSGGLSSTAISFGQISTTAIVSSAGPTPATSGFLRLNNNSDFVAWRNAANTGDDKIYFDNTDTLQIIGTGGIEAPIYKVPDLSTNKVVSLQATAGSSAYTAFLPLNPPQAVGIVQMNPSGTLFASSTLPANLNFPGKAVQENNNNIVVSNVNATNSLSILRGSFLWPSQAITGEGFTATTSGAGAYNVTFSPPFSDAPAVTASALGFGGQYYSSIVPYPNSSGFIVYVGVSSSASFGEGFSFIAIGQRA